MPTEVFSSLDEYQVTSVTGAQIIINPWVWYSYNILVMKNVKSKSRVTRDSDNRAEYHNQQMQP